VIGSVVASAPGCQLGLSKVAKRPIRVTALGSID